MISNFFSEAPININAYQECINLIPSYNEEIPSQTTSSELEKIYTYVDNINKFLKTNEKISALQPANNNDELTFRHIVTLFQQIKNHLFLLINGNPHKPDLVAAELDEQLWVISAHINTLKEVYYVDENSKSQVAIEAYRQFLDEARNRTEQTFFEESKTTENNTDQKLKALLNVLQNNQLPLTMEIEETNTFFNIP